MRYLLSIVFCCGILSCLYAQEQVLQGIVIDSVSRNALAFVSIQVDGKPELAGMSDIDGKFRLVVPALPAQVRFSYIGYKIKTLTVENASAGQIGVLMSPTSLVLREVQIKAGENPAHRIVRKTWEYRARHDPAQLDAYRCNTYNKLILTGRKDTVRLASDEAAIRKTAAMDSLFGQQHLFMIESYSTRLFKKGRSKEIVKASKVSGSKDASIFMMALEYQPFTFYEPLVEVSGKKYVNPISRNSDEIYFFSLEDTLFSGRDTVYVISFKPRKNKIFDAFRGLLYISAPDFAIQNVIAEPDKAEGIFRIKVQQQYSRLSSGQWFPEQLNTDLRFPSISIPGNIMVGESRTYVSSPEINPAIRDREFDEVALEVASDASNQTDAYWDSVRIQKLSSQEKRTYLVIDSISKASNLELKLKLAESVARGYWPVKFFDLDISRLIAFNQYEGFRLGLGGITNDRLSKRFGLGGYYAYGFKDVHSKYKAEGRLYLTLDRDFYLGLSWGRDVYETGGMEIVNDRKPKLSESVRMILIGRMHQEERSQAELGFRVLRNVNATAFIRQTHNRALFDYQFKADATGRQYSWLEPGLALRIAWGAKYYQSGSLKLDLGTKYPLVYAQLVYGKALGGSTGYDYVRTELKIEKTIDTRRVGQMHIQFAGGYVAGEVPAMRLFTGRANALGKDILKVSAFNAFETMLMNEVLCNQYASLYLQQDLGSFFRIKSWSPRFSISQASMWGSLAGKNEHKGLNTSDAQNGFFEAGLKLSELLRFSTGSYGAGGFYRFGPFADANWKKNVFVKLNVGLVF